MTIPDARVLEIAKVCHEANRAYCQTLGDNSQLAWELAPEWQRESVIKGVMYHLNTPAAGPADSHESWMLEKLEQGWEYGPVKSELHKTHPCMVPYHELPEAQQAKDRLFIAVIRALGPRELRS